MSAAFEVLVDVDLSAADLRAFEAYEAQALALLPAHGGAALRFRVRAVDGGRETHLLAFPDRAAFEAFRGGVRGRPASGGPRRGLGADGRPRPGQLRARGLVRGV